MAAIVKLYLPFHWQLKSRCVRVLRYFFLVEKRERESLSYKWCVYIVQSIICIHIRMPIRQLSYSPFFPYPFLFTMASMSYTWAQSCLGTPSQTRQWTKHRSGIKNCHRRNNLNDDDDDGDNNNNNIYNMIQGGFVVLPKLTFILFSTVKHTFSILLYTRTFDQISSKWTQIDWSILIQRMIAKKEKKWIESARNI